MSVFKKLLFWKREDEFDFDDLAEKEIQRGIPQDDLGLEQKPLTDEQPLFPDDQPTLDSPFTPPSRPRLQSRTPTTPPAAGADRDIELINSKLDTIKAMLTSLEQRMANVEQALGGEKKGRLW